VTLKQIDIRSAAIADTQISEITSESKNAYVQALSMGASATQALAAADAAAAAVVDRLVSDTSTILMSVCINCGRNVVFDHIREKGRRLSAISTAGSANGESGDESNARKVGIYGHCHVSRAARPNAGMAG
jgi:uncharacterized protein (DUF488 family)